MKTVVKGAIRNEKGNVLILVLILLVVGGLILTPLLGLMGTGLLAGKVYEKKMDELYAADAGVEDAIWKIMHSENISYPYYYPKPLTVNNKSVDVEIYREEMPESTACRKVYRHQILSIAATDDGGGTAAIDSSTTVEAYIIGTITYLSMLDHLITIHENLDEQEVEQLENDLGKLDIPCPEGCTECEKCAKAYDYYSDDYENISQECKGCIAVYNFAEAGWPTVSDLSARYWDDVKDKTHYYGDTEIDLNGANMDLGPLYVDGELDILNSSNDEATLILTGTLYITGDTLIGQNGKDTLTLDLNGQTIFVESSTADALIVGGKCTVKGPGCIIAVGDVYFAPKGDVGSNGEPVLILSVSGTTTLKPSGDFYGAIGGSVNVEAFSGETPTTTYPTGGFGEVNFPSLFEVKYTYSIVSWEINPD